MSITGSEQWMYSSGREFYDFPIEQSLRFNDNDSAYLSRTPATAGNRKTWTWSGWVKRGNLNANTVGNIPTLFAAQDSSAGLYNVLMFLNAGDNDTIRAQLSSTPSNASYYLATSQVFRDMAGWYHIVWSVDTTQATASDRAKLYVNGEQVTSFSTAQYPPQNTDTDINYTVEHNIGKFPDYTRYYDGYMAEVNFIDGQALDPTSFGEFKSGIWTPVDTSGLTFGTNGFRLQFGDTTEANGFNTVTYTGKGGAQSISGVGFSSAPDLVWIKNRSSAAEHVLHDSVRGAANLLQSDSTAAELNRPTYLTSFDSDGFSFGDNVSNYNTSGSKYVAWCWDAGSGSAASNTDGSITSTVKANTDYGFSIVSYTGNNTDGATVGHGLGAVPSLVITKSRSTTSLTGWMTKHKDLASNYNVALNKTDAAWNPSSNGWVGDLTSDTTFSLENGTVNGNNANQSGVTYIAYCFAEKTGYSSISSYTGDGTTDGSKTITTGFKPAFVMMKNASTGSTNWLMFDNTRETKPTIELELNANNSNAESNNGRDVTFTDTGFTVAGNNNINGNGDTYIYMAFADTRDAAFWRDTSGEGNDWQPNNLVFSDVVLDSTTNNFAVLSLSRPPASSGATLAEGNLKYTTGTTGGSNDQDRTFVSSILTPTTGKWYAEYYATNANMVVQVNAYQGDQITGTNTNRIGLINTGLVFETRTTGTPVSAAYGGTFTTGDVIQVYVDMDNSPPRVAFGKGGLWGDGSGSWNQSVPTSFREMGSDFLTDSTSNDGQVAFSGVSIGGASNASGVANFGQDSTFAGAVSAGGNVDANGLGDFKYTVPDGALSLCSANLPTGAIDTLNDETPEDYFNTVLYTGDGVGQSITGVGFQPDWTWIKCRSAASSHSVYDVNRGIYKALLTDSTSAELNLTGAVTSFTSDGFTLGTEGLVNTSGRTYVGWNWKANGSGVSNTDGSITSTVSVGATSQQNWFSVASYSGNSVAGATVGHGLNTEPDMIIVKSRTATSGYLNWGVYHKDLGATKVIYLNTTGAESTAVGAWNNTAPTSSVFSLGNDGGFGFGISGQDYIAYCFANAEGLCKVGSYVGNGSDDGVFVFTGHRPSFVLIKNSSGANSWQINDDARDEYNVMTRRLFPDLSNAENTASLIDFTSNGFKIRKNHVEQNTSGQTYIYLSIGSQPFKFANAR